MWNLLQNCNTAQLSSRSKRLCCSQSWLPHPSFRFRVACWPRGREWKRGRPRAAEGRKAGTSGSTEDGVWGRGASCWGHGAEPWGPEAASPLLPPRGPRLNFSASWPPGRGTREVGLFFSLFFPSKVPVEQINRYVPCLFFTEDAGEGERKVAGAGQPCLFSKLYSLLEKGALRELPNYYHPVCSLIYSCFLR